MVQSEDRSSPAQARETQRRPNQPRNLSRTRSRARPAPTTELRRRSGFSPTYGPPHRASHVPPVDAADLVERPRDLPERGDLHRLHHLGEQVAALLGDALQLRQGFGRLGAVARLERREVVDLLALLLLARVR